MTFICPKACLRASASTKVYTNHFGSCTFIVKTRAYFQYIQQFKTTRSNIEDIQWILFTVNEGILFNEEMCCTTDCPHEVSSESGGPAQDTLSYGVRVGKSVCSFSLFLY